MSHATPVAEAIVKQMCAVDTVDTTDDPTDMAVVGDRVVVGGGDRGLDRNYGVTMAISDLRNPPPSVVTERRWRQYTRFLLVGISNAIVDLAVLNVLLLAYPTQEPLPLIAYNTLAVGLAILNSYLWNTRWTFRAEATHSRRERLLFIGQALINILVNNLVLVGVTSLLPDMQGTEFLIWSNIVKLAAMILASSISFLLLRAIVFHPRLR